MAPTRWGTNCQPVKSAKSTVTRSMRSGRRGSRKPSTFGIANRAKRRARSTANSPTAARQGRSSMITWGCAAWARKPIARRMKVLCLLGFSLAARANTAELPGAYFRLLEAGATQVEARLNAEPSATLETLEALPGWSHFPYSMLASAVLYSKKHATNPRYHDPKMLALTLRIGDLLAAES